MQNDDVKRAFESAASDVLMKALGGTSAAAILYIANPRDALEKPEEFSKALKELYDQAAEMLLVQIVDDFYQKLGLKRNPGSDFVSSVREAIPKL